jgi:CBS domain containing-hemolysin-like protein
MTIPLSIALALLLAALTLVSYVEGIYSESGKFLSREFQENIEAYEQAVEPRLKVSRSRASLSMSVLAQLITAAIAIIIGYELWHEHWTRSTVAQAAATLVLIVIIFNRLLPYILFTRTRGSWIKHVTLVLRLLIYAMMPVTLILGFCLSVASLTKEHPPEEPEHPSEAVDALIEAGQEEGILEESDRELIQSVVEFGDKTVHEVMTPRPDIFAVPVNMTVEQFTDALRDHAYSRVPVYEGTIDSIKGIVFAHDVLQVPDTEARTRTVGELMREAHFVPESQRVSSLLREMQRENAHMAIVVDEYGAVAGVVTMEDMVEEIVGEIHDEHEEKPDVVREADNTYVVPGNMDVDRLDDLFGIRPEGSEATTISGLLTEKLGRIPTAGEVVEENGLRFEILESTEFRVDRVRISATARPEQMHA